MLRSSQNRSPSFRCPFTPLQKTDISTSFLEDFLKNWGSTKKDEEILKKRCGKISPRLFLWVASSGKLAFPSFLVIALSFLSLVVLLLPRKTSKMTKDFLSLPNAKKTLENKKKHPFYQGNSLLEINQGYLDIFENPYGAPRRTESENPPSKKKYVQNSRKPRLSPKVNPDYPQK